MQTAFPVTLIAKGAKNEPLFEVTQGTLNKKKHIFTLKSDETVQIPQNQYYSVKNLREKASRLVIESYISNN